MTGPWRAGLRRRVIAAFLVAPLLPAICIFAWFATSEPLRGLSVFDLVLRVLFLAAPSYAISVLFGVPVYWFLSRYRLTHCLFFLATGAVGGMLPVAYFAVPDAIQTIQIEDAASRAYWWEIWWSLYGDLLLVTAAAGAGVAGAVWLIARPDRAAARHAAAPHAAA